VFFFQAEDGIRDFHVTGVQTCALPIYLDGNRAQYKGYSKEEFINNFRVDDILFEAFIDYCLANTIKLDFYAFEERIKLYIKATLAEQLFDPNVYAKIKSGRDDMLKKVLELDTPTIKQQAADKIEATN